MIVACTLVFHPNGRLYFCSQTRRLRDPDEVSQWESQGYLVRQVEVDLPVGVPAPELVKTEESVHVG